MKIKRSIVVLDTSDLDGESSFWAGLFSGRVREGADFHGVEVDGLPVLEVQFAPNHRRPAWPDGDQQQQAHLDLYVADLDAAVAEASGLGASVLSPERPTDHPAGPQPFVVLASPAGHPFCFCRA